MTDSSLPSCIKTTCAYCGVGCGIQARVDDEETHAVTIVGDKEHPANFGRLCSKGSALGETVGFEDRLLKPVVDGEETDWEQALDAVVERMTTTIEKYGPESVALYGSGQLLTEDYYVANKLMKGFVGSANIDTNSRLCMASTVAGQKRAFGEDVVPGCYEDLELAELIVLVGSNTAWCHPVIYQRMQAAGKARVVVIDPRATATSETSDLYLPIQPGTDTILFAGLLVWLAEHQHVNHSWVQEYTENFDQALANARSLAPDLATVSDLCGLELQTLETFYCWFTTTEKTVTAWSQGVNQGFDGTDRVNAIINVHLATGRIGQPGCGPLSLTGQPNAMGGREVGGLANQLAAHMDFSQEDDIERVQRFWKAANMARKPGLTAVDMFAAVGRGEIRFLWIMGTNPAVSMPNADKVRAALETCEHVVVSDCMANTDTGAYADILLPAAPWSEKDGTVTNSERRISRQRALFPLAGDARPDWWVLAQVGQRLGFADAFSYQNNVDVFREHAVLSAFENSREQRFRHFHIGAFQNLSQQEYDSFVPVQWPVSREDCGVARLFEEGGFSSPSGRAKFVLPETVRSKTKVSGYPLLFNTGRIRDQWHTMTRTARSPRLNRHIDEPYVQVHPEDAARFKVAEGCLGEVLSEQGQAIARVKVDEAVQPGQIFMPMHWTQELCRGGLMGSVVHGRTDPISRQPDSKATPVNLKPFSVDWYGVLISREQLDLPDLDYCTAVREEVCWRYELGFQGAVDNALKLLPAGDRLKLVAEGAVQREAVFDQQGLKAVLLLSRQPLNIDRSWLQQQFSDRSTLPSWRVLAGCSGSGAAQGAVVCACFGVTEGQIAEAITECGTRTAADLGRELKAGTNCGSCVPELKKQLQKAYGGDVRPGGKRLELAG